MFYFFRSILLLAALCLASAPGSVAHEIPVDVTVHSIVKPTGDRLQIVVRVPLRAIRDVEFPEFGPGYLDIEALSPQLRDLATLWFSNSIEVYEDGEHLPPPRIVSTQLSFESDRSFASFDDAVAHITAPLMPNSANAVWSQVWFDVLLEYPIRSEASQFSMRPGLEGLAARVVTVLRFLPPGGAERAYEIVGDPGIVPLDPRWHQAAWRFVVMGFFHILGGTDHLLFLLCLVIPFRRLRPLVLIVTAFTVAHSFTLIASAYGFVPDGLWFPPLIETLIAASIFYMALENIVGVTPVRRRWMFAMGFGLVHGFGFSFALRETLQFAGSNLVTSLLAFNVGVEIGQLLVLLILVPALGALFRFVVAERMGTIILSALVAHTGWHWMIERGENFALYTVDQPALNAAVLVAVTLIVLGGTWLGVNAYRQRAHRAKINPAG